MNKKGGTVLLSLIVAGMIFLVGFVFLNFIQTDITTARIGLDCTNANITDGSKVTCLIVDIVVPYFIIVIISVSGGMITSKFIGKSK